MKLSNTQRTVLSTALQRDDGTIALAANLKGGAAQKVVGKLLTECLIEEIPARGSMPVWRKDAEERPTALRIVVMENGFAWEGKTFRSLSETAQAITGTNWNGPRFFGLRSKSLETSRSSGLVAEESRP